MSKLYKNINYDIKAGFARNILYYLVWGLVIILFTVPAMSELKEMHPESVCSGTDVLIDFLLGVDGNNIFEGNQLLQFPMEWFAIQMYILIGIARFPRQDYEECGYHIWIRTRSKVAWWVSKVIWCFLHIVFSYIICECVIVIVTWIGTGNLSLEANHLSRLNLLSVPVGKMNSILSLCPIFVTFAVGMITMTISLCFDGLMGLLTGTVIVLLSVFVDNPLAVGRYMMLYSYFSKQNEYQYSIWLGAVLCLVLITVFGVIGYVMFRRKEI